jgi:hypothetical protein
MMALTQEMFTGEPSLSMKQLYVTCILCRDGGIIEYSPNISIDYLIGDTKSSMTHVSPVFCDSCENQRKNEDAIEYFNTHGVELSYVKSTLVYHEAMLLRQSTPTILSVNERVGPLGMFTLMTDLKDKCTLYSMEYDDGRLFPVSMDRPFFGIWCD